MKKLSRDHHIYYLDPAAAPAITIDSGEELMVETWDAFEGHPDVLIVVRIDADRDPSLTVLSIAAA